MNRTHSRKLDDLVKVALLSGSGWMNRPGAVQSSNSNHCSQLSTVPYLCSKEQHQRVAVISEPWSLVFRSQFTWRFEYMWLVLLVLVLVLVRPLVLLLAVPS